MDTADTARRIIDGDRRALARAITLVESGRTDHRAQARQYQPDRAQERSKDKKRNEGRKESCRGWQE